MEWLFGSDFDHIGGFVADDFDDGDRATADTSQLSGEGFHGKMKLG